MGEEPPLSEPFEPPSTFRFSVREKQILLLMARGSSNRQVASSLHLAAEVTVKRHSTVGHSRGWGAKPLALRTG